MPVKLIVAAEDWQSKSVKCTFTVQAGDVTLVAKERSKQIYELPAGTNAVRVTATPTTSTQPGSERPLGDEGGAGRRERRHRHAQGRVPAVGRREAGGRRRADAGLRDG